MNEVGHWLEGLGLGRYATSFSENDIEFDLLSKLTDADLEKLGVASLGHRKRLLKAIAALSGETSTFVDTKLAKAASEIPPPATPDAERRHLTVMFCDLVGSTALSERLDPEDLREVIHTYQECCAGVVARFGGFIARYMGDGLLVYFGYPQAHEDDAERAIRAGLGIVEAVGELRPRDDLTLQVRVGIATGLVVAGDHIGAGASEEMAVVGEAPNLAARLQGLAEPDTVVIAPSTYRLAGGLFVCDDLGPQHLKGITEPVPAFLVRQAGHAPSRFEATAERRLTALVGREEEIGLLLKRWEQAKDGDGQVVLLSGEAGVGKSRILRSFREQLEDKLRNQVLYYCSPYHRNSAFHPAIDQLERVLRFEKHDGAAEKLIKLEAALGDLSLLVEKYAPPLASLLSLPVGDRYTSPPLGAEEMKKKILEALIAMFEAMASRGQVLIAVEDLHWIDPSTLELLNLLIEHLRTARVVLVVTYRPEFDSPWSGHAHVTGLMLNRLSRKESAAMVARVAGGKALPEEILGEIVTKTDGVALFVEELTKTVLESGLLEETEDGYVLSGPLQPLAIPATLQDSLMARLDRLASVKEVAQLAATLGRNFSHELLAAVSPLEGEALDDAVSQLLDAGLIYRHGLPPDVTYEFKHALVQDVAYQSLLKNNRLQFHKRIAHALEKHFPETEPEILAHHYTNAGLTETAFIHWHKAGQRAIERSANIEAISHLNKGIDLLGKLPSTEKRNLQELDLQMALSTPLQLTKGFAAPEVESTFSRALELCEQVGETPKHFSALWGVTYCYGVRSPGAKPELAEQMFQLAESEGDQIQRLVAHRVLGARLVVQAKYTEALELLQQGLALYDREQHRSLAYVYGQDMGVVCQQWSAWTLWFLGYPDQALNMSREAALLARETSHPMTEVYVAVFTAMFHRFRREAEPARKLAERAVKEAADQGFGLFLASANVLRGSLLTVESMDDGIALMQEGLTGWRATGAELFVPFYLALIAEAYGETGKAVEGLAALDEAQTIADKGGRDGERLWDAELCRIKGELLLGRSHPAQAEACFQEALQLARSQRAKSWELRASVSLSRLWKKRGQKKEARELLQGIYDWFTEGFDTPDLIEAKELLNALK